MRLGQHRPWLGILGALKGLALLNRRRNLVRVPWTYPGLPELPLLGTGFHQSSTGLPQRAFVPPGFLVSLPCFPGCAL